MFAHWSPEPCYHGLEKYLRLEGISEGLNLKIVLVSPKYLVDWLSSNVLYAIQRQVRLRCSIITALKAPILIAGSNLNVARTSSQVFADWLLYMYPTYNALCQNSLRVKLEITR